MRRWSYVAVGRRRRSDYDLYLVAARYVVERDRITESDWVLADWIVGITAEKHVTLKGIPDERYEAYRSR